MLIHNHAVGSTNRLLQTHEGADEAADTGRPVLVLQVGSQLDPGIKRRNQPNEDSLFVAQDLLHAATHTKPVALFAIADGMGGHAHGQEASQLAVQLLVEYVDISLPSKQLTPDALLPLLSAGVQHANQVVYQRNQEQRADMGTTMTAALVSDTTAYIAHVGDSRAYLYHEPAGLSQITHDHSIAAALAEAGVIRPEDVSTHPRRNVIYRCLGHENTVEVDTCAVPLTGGDMLLLCSDGLWEMVRDPQIAHILAIPMSDPTQVANMLVQAALAGGGTDNVSVIVVQMLKNVRGSF